MTTQNKSKRGGLLVDYRPLGTITLDELFHALHEDIQALKDLHNIEFVTGPRLILPVTDGYGEPVTPRRAGGRPMHQMFTYHHKPACKDYDL